MRDKIKVNDLLGMLESINPGLATIDMVPILCSYCFDKQEGVVYAYDGTMALGVLDTDYSDFGCGVSSKLFDVLKVLPSDASINFEMDEGSVKISGAGRVVRVDEGSVKISGAGRAVRVPTTSKNSFVFEFPWDIGKEESGIEIGADEGFVEDIDFLLRIADENIYNKVRMGVTLSYSVKDGFVLYSADNVMVARIVSGCSVKPIGVKAYSTILPKVYCQQIKRLYGGVSTEMQLGFYESGSFGTADSDDKNMVMFCNLPYDSKDVEKLEPLFESNLEGVGGQVFSFPEELLEACKVASVMGVDRLTVEVADAMNICISSKEHGLEYFIDLDGDGICTVCSDIFKISTEAIIKLGTLFGGVANLKMQFLENCILVSEGDRVEVLVSIFKDA